MAKGASVPEGARLTHVFLNGGRASVPDHLRPAFLREYAAAVLRREPLYVVERSMPTYRMFADLDVHCAPSATTAAARMQCVARVLDAALAALPAEGPLCAPLSICVRVGRGPGALDKVGAHLVWEDLVVDDTSAARLRDAWVASATTHHSDVGDWESILDGAVYKRNGLRMPWSLKRGAAEGDVYEPFGTWDRATGLVAIPAPSVTSCLESVVGWLHRTTLFTYSTPDDDAAVRVKRRGSPVLHMHPKAASRSRADADAGECLSPADAAALRRALPAVYAACEFPKVLHTPGAATLVVTTDSRYCHHIGRRHRGNHVYLVLCRDGAVLQKCHSTTEDDAGCPCARVSTRIADAHPLGHLFSTAEKKTPGSLRPPTTRSRARLLCEKIAAIRGG